jgi:diguanylate cyclase (GGDEF)-like protein
MASQLHLLICDNLRSEVASAIQAEEFSDVALSTFPSDFCIAKKGWDGLRELVSQFPPGNQVVLLGGGCLSRLKEPPPDLKSVQVYQLEQCFHFFVSPPVLERCLRQGAYVLTPGWLARWRDYVEHQWQMNRQTAQEFFRESTSHLLLLDTLTDQNSAQHLAEFSDYLGLPHETVPIGLDYFRLFLGKLVLEWHWKFEKEAAYETLARASRQSADYATTLDLIGSLTGIMTEEQVVDRVLMLLTMLVAPSKIIFVSIIDGKPGSMWPCTAEDCDPSKVLEHFDFAEDYAWNEDGQGFRLKIIYRGETLGLVEIAGFAFPQYEEHYLNITLVVARVCGLAINNARAYHTLDTTIQELQTQIAARTQVEKRLRYLSTHDTMTELYNRAFFEEELARLKHSRQFPVSLIMADLDDLKIANDRFGHGAGDQLLQRAARVLRQCFRGEDLVARIGGDEFAILMPNTPPEPAQDAMARIRRACQEQNAIAGLAPLSISLGMATAANGDELPQALKLADARMYEDKNKQKEQPGLQ